MMLTLVLMLQWKRASTKHRSVQPHEHAAASDAQDAASAQRGSSAGIAFGPEEGAEENNCVCHGIAQTRLEGPHLVESAAGWRYIGHWRGGLRHGNGAWESEGHGSYEGKWERNQMHGEGTFKWPNGDTFNGVFDEGCPVRGEL
eukprot:1554552-Rhodomonas_salina.2